MLPKVRAAPRWNNGCLRDDDVLSSLSCPAVPAAARLRARAEGLVAETAHTMRIRKQSGLCRYYLCILLLFGILMALLVLG